MYLGKVRKIRTENDGVLYSTLFCELQKPLYRIDIVFFIEIVYGSGPFHALVYTRGEYEAFATLEMRPYLLVRHFEIVAVFDLHFGRQNGSGRQRRERYTRHFVSSCDKFPCGFAAQKSCTANHKNFHVYSPDIYILLE